MDSPSFRPTHARIRSGFLCLARHWLEMTVIAVIGEKKSQRRGRRPDDTRQVPMFYAERLARRGQVFAKPAISPNYETWRNRHRARRHPGKRRSRNRDHRVLPELKKPRRADHLCRQSQVCRRRQDDCGFGRHRLRGLPCYPDRHAAQQESLSCFCARHRPVLQVAANMRLEFIPLRWLRRPRRSGRMPTSAPTW